MSSHSVRYGIDLGTTNSAIARVDRGQVQILKNDLGHDTTPSAVHYGSRGIRVGLRARSQWFREQLENVGKEQDARIETAFLEFKRTMGTSHRYVPSSHPDASGLSEELSGELLKELLRFARSRTGGDPTAVVVTIPAAFRVPQQQATHRAAEFAGIRECHLLQEPVAAAMAFGLEADPDVNAKWLVFDFGGGTFDVALVLCEDGQITVRDTEGDNRLGGKELDLAVVDRFIWPGVAKQAASDTDVDRTYLRQGLRQFSEPAIIDLSLRETAYVEPELGTELGNGQEIDLDLALTRTQLRAAVEPVFQRAIDKTNLLLGRHGLRGADLDDLVLVGGPTFSPILRSMVSQQLRPPNISVDPMTAVARGAALYASTLTLDERTIADSPAAPGRVALAVEHETTSINDEEFVTVRYRSPEDEARVGPLELELRSESGSWRSSWTPLAPDGVLFTVLLDRGRPNTFALSARTAHGRLVPTSPTEITIIHGVKLTGSPLTNNLGVAAWNEDRTRRIFRTLEGAEKSRPLPVTGTATLRTARELRPGTNDRLRIVIHEGGADADGQRLLHCDGEVMALELRGDEIENAVPEGAPLRLSITTKDSSAEPARATVFFEALDEEYDLEIPVTTGPAAAPADWVDDEVAEAEGQLGKLRESGRASLTALRELERELRAEAQRFRETAGEDDTDGWMQALDRLKETLRELYRLVDGDEWGRLEAELDEAWQGLESDDSGADGMSDPRLRELANSLEGVKDRKDVRLGRSLLERMRNVAFQRHRGAILRGFIVETGQNFAGIEWKDPVRARSEVDAAVQCVLNDGSEDRVGSHARRIWSLMAEPPGGGDDFDPRDLPQV